MTEHPDSAADVEAPEGAAPAGQERPGQAQAAHEPAAHEPAGHEPAGATGHPAVDEVLRSLEELDQRPVDEHVALFEKAHEDLRRALSDASGDQPSSR